MRNLFFPANSGCRVKFKNPRKVRKFKDFYDLTLCRQHTTSTCVGTEPEYYMAKVITQNYPHLLPESIKLICFTPPGNFPPFRGFHPFSESATPAIHFGKIIAHFVSPLSISLSHLGTIGTFFPARISFMISSVSSCRQNRLRM